MIPLQNAVLRPVDCREVSPEDQAKTMAKDYEHVEVVPAQTFAGSSPD